MAALARWCFHHRRMVLAIWLVALLGFGGIDRAVGASYANNFSLPATDSSRALDILKANFPSQAGDSEQIVLQAKQGTLDDPATRAAVTACSLGWRSLPHVRAVISPYGPGGQISKDRTIGLATVYLDALAQNVPKEAVSQLIDAAKSADSSVLNVQLGGNAIENNRQSQQPTSEGSGIIFALIVLFFAFRRSFLCALLPLISALMAIGVGHVDHRRAHPRRRRPCSSDRSSPPWWRSGSGSTTPSSSSAATATVCWRARTPEDAAITALNTSGGPCSSPGLTICIALLGMFALQVSFLYGVALSATFVVALTMLASLTLLPAMLGFFGTEGPAPGRTTPAGAAGPQPERSPGLLAALGGGAGRSGRGFSASLALASSSCWRCRSSACGSGSIDAGNDPASSTTRQAYDLLAQGFGPGFNGPLQVVGKINSPADSARFAAFVESLQDQPGVARGPAAAASPNGKAEVAVVFPKTAPQDAQTTGLLHRDAPRGAQAEAGTRSPSTSGV